MSTHVLDDMDRRVHYSSDWEWPTLLSPRTLHQTWDIGASAVFVFTGTAVTVIGNIHEGFHREEIRVDFALDGAPPSRALRVCVERNITDHVWFQVQDLPNKEHTLVLTYRGDDDIPFELDRIEYVGELPVPIGTGDGSLTTTAPNTATGATSTTMVGGGVPSGVAAAEKSRFPVGAVVGSVVGSIILVSIAFFVIFVVWRKRKMVSKRRSPLRYDRERRDSEFKTNSNFQPIPFQSEQVISQTASTVSYHGGASSSTPNSAVISPHPSARSKAVMAGYAHETSTMSSSTPGQRSVSLYQVTLPSPTATTQRGLTAPSGTVGSEYRAAGSTASQDLSDIVDTTSMLGALQGLPPAYSGARSGRIVDSKAQPAEESVLSTSPRSESGHSMYTDLRSVSNDVGDSPPAYR